MPEHPDKIRFHYIKSHLFRVAHVDGAMASISPTGDIVVSLYSQRTPIPQVTVQPVNEDGSLGDEIISERTGKDGLVREIEISIAAHSEIIKSLIKLLQEKVEQYEKLVQEKEARQESS